MAVPSLPANKGTGPGVITPDGCAVEFYALLSAGPEPEIVHAACGRAPSTILELGAGTGRISSALATLGHFVVAVDESPEMLAHVRHAETVRARIEGLRLGRRFDVVLLPSYLINAPDAQLRDAFLQTCAQHVSPAGCVIIQQHSPAWFANAAVWERESNGMIMRLTDVQRPGPDLVSATAEYEAEGRTWTHSFTAMRLNEVDLCSSLLAAGLRFDRYLSSDQEWVCARPDAHRQPGRQGEAPR